MSFASVPSNSETPGANVKRPTWMGDFFAYRAHTKIRWWHWFFAPYYGTLFVAVIAVAIWYNVVAHHHLNLDPTWKWN